MRLKKKRNESSEISTASMPDIVFLLLFFFMVSATIKTNDEQVEIEPPMAHAVTQVKKKFLIKELSVGYPKNGNFGKEPRIASGDIFLEMDQIGNWVQQQKTALGEQYGDQLIVLIKAHEEVPMGMITDLQQELRKYNARKVLYRTLEI